MKNIVEMFPDLSVFLHTFTPSVLWAIVLLVFAVFFLFTAILLFHWRRYGMGNRRIMWAQALYFIVSGIILLLMVSSALAII